MIESLPPTKLVARQLARFDIHSTHRQIEVQYEVQYEGLMINIEVQSTRYQVLGSFSYGFFLLRFNMRVDDQRNGTYDYPW